MSNRQILGCLFGVAAPWNRGRMAELAALVQAFSVSASSAIRPGTKADEPIVRPPGNRRRIRATCSLGDVWVARPSLTAYDGLNHEESKAWNARVPRGPSRCGGVGGGTPELWFRAPGGIGHLPGKSNSCRTPRSARGRVNRRHAAPRRPSAHSTFDGYRGVGHVPAGPMRASPSLVTLAEAPRRGRLSAKSM